MTAITRKLVRVTNAKHRGDAIVAELHATALFVRTKGSRDSFPLPYTDLYEIAAMRHGVSTSPYLQTLAAAALNSTSWGL